MPPPFVVDRLSAEVERLIEPLFVLTDSRLAAPAPVVVINPVPLMETLLVELVFNVMPLGAVIAPLRIMAPPPSLIETLLVPVPVMEPVVVTVPLPAMLTTSF